MSSSLPKLLAISLLALASFALFTPAARADETDNFTERAPLPDALPAMDATLIKWITEGIDATNKRNDKGKRPCDEDRLRSEIRKRISGFHLNPRTLQGRSHLELWTTQSPDIVRRHIKFMDSIYSGKRYDSVVRYPMNRNIIKIADSITLAGHYVGLDKLNHFIREGLKYYDKGMQQAAAGGTDRATALKDSLDKVTATGLQLESGIQGMATTGVFSYADLAANYSGYRFWSDLLDFTSPNAYIACDAKTGLFAWRAEHPFTLANYVNGAWDEGINCSTYNERVGASVKKIMRQRNISCPLNWDECRRLAALPNADRYVTPACLAAAKSEKTESSPPSPAVSPTDSHSK